ncbi:hypothetical protein ACET3Z_021097 [Daucus carota]
MNNTWLPHPKGVIKLNVPCSFNEAPLGNGNQNGISIVAKDNNGAYLRDVMVLSRA